MASLTKLLNGSIGVKTDSESGQVNVRKYVNTGYSNRERTCQEIIKRLCLGGASSFCAE